MNNFKKIMNFTLTLLTIFAFTACGSDSEEDQKGEFQKEITCSNDHPDKLTQMIVSWQLADNELQEKLDEVYNNDYGC